MTQPHTPRPPRIHWSDEMIQRTRELAAASLSATAICILLEDEFGETCNEGTLRFLMSQHGICWLGHIGRRAA